MYGCESVYMSVIVCVCVSLWVREYVFVCVTCIHCVCDMYTLCVCVGICGH